LVVLTELHNDGPSCVVAGESFKNVSKA